MSRNDFMKQLEHLLQNVPPAEREEALQYYNDYFDDAGAENEKEVIEALGNPARVAENIKRDLTENSESVSAKASDRALVEYGKDSSAAMMQAQQEKGKKQDLPTWAVVLLVLLLILASPVILGAGVAVLGVVIAILAVWFSLILAFGSISLALMVSMFTLVIVGIMCVPADFIAGAGVVGAGLLCGGIGILFLMLAVAMGGIATPAVCRRIAGLFRKKSSAGKES